jgi:hypothetical protein
MSRALGQLYNLANLVVGFQISRAVEKPFHSTMAVISIVPSKPKANVIQYAVAFLGYNVEYDPCGLLCKNLWLIRGQ